MALQTMSTTNSNSSLIDTIGKLADLYGDKTKTETGGTTTQQTIIDPAAAQNLINTILGGTSGLAAVSSGQKGAGLYNSSTNQLLVNDLLSRTAGEVAARGAPTVVTRPDVRTTQQAPLGIGSSLLTTGALVLGNKVLKSSGITDKMDKGIDDFVKSIFGPSETAGSLDFSGGFGNTSGVDLGPAVGGGFNAGSNTFSSDLGISSSFGAADAASYIEGAGSASNISYGGTAASTGNVVAANSAATAADTTGYTDIASYSDSANYADNATYADDLVDGGASASSSGLESGYEAGAESGLEAGAESGAEAGASSGVPYVGVAYNVATGNYGTAAGAALGGAIGNAIVPVVGGFVGSAIGGYLGSNCFITTAVLNSLGITDDKCEELETLRRFRDTWLKENHPEDIAQYYREAPDLAVKLSAASAENQLSYFIYVFFILPAIEHINKEQYEEAYEIYRFMFNNVKSYLTSDPAITYKVKDYVTNY